MLPPARVAPSVGKIIGQARQAKGFNQKDLSTRISEKPNVVSEYETGRAIPNPQILAKMERVLGVKLRGKNIGAPVRMTTLTSLAARKSSGIVHTSCNLTPSIITENHRAACRAASPGQRTYRYHQES